MEERRRKTARARPAIRRGVVFFAPLSLVMMGAGCQEAHRADAATARTTSPATVRNVRVLLADGHRRCRFRVDGSFVVKGPGGGVIAQERRRDWVEVRVDRAGGIRLGDRSLGAGPIEIVPDNQPIELRHPKGSVWTDTRRYPGFIRLSVNAKGRLRVINLVDLDDYVACVLPGELFPHFEREAFRAQAIAARTYALYEMGERGDRAYDVSATEMSQVYPGITDAEVASVARAAAKHTRGIVTTWSAPAGQRIFCTFYSACCGGRTQSVANCRSDVAAIPPLAGGVPCGCPRIATSYRWKPTRISKGDLTQRLISSRPRLKRLGRIESVEVAETTAWGRPKVLRLRGSSGDSEKMIAEDFRLAVGSRTIRSTNMRIVNRPQHIEFTGGKGFGHGMGLCQWGMQEMALRGATADAILKHYYPSARLTRAY